LAISMVVTKLSFLEKKINKVKNCRFARTHFVRPF
jgi:hypothetical protein